MLEYNDLILAFQELKLNDKAVVAHASLRAFGQVAGGRGLDGDGPDVYDGCSHHAGPYLQDDDHARIGPSQ